MFKGIILDFDGTITDSVKAYCEYYNWLFKDHAEFIPADPTKVRRWDLADECPLAVECCEDMFADRTFFEKLDFYPQALETIIELSGKNELTICSIGTKMNLHHKAKWINNQIYDFVPNLILMSNKGVKMDKSCINMDGFIFVDDSSKNLNSSNASFKICYGLEAEWNADWKGLRAKDWTELRKIFVSLGVI